MPRNYEEIVEQSHLNVTALSKKIKELDKFNEQIKNVTSQNIEMPLYFNKLFEEIMEISVQYTESLGKASENYLKGNNKILASKITDFERRLAEFKEQIIRLSKADFNALFEGLQKEFILKTQEDLQVEYIKLATRTEDLQRVVSKLGNVAKEFENIDFAKLFNEVHVQLSNIHQSTNKISSNLEALKQGSNSIQQSIGEIKNNLKENHELFLDRIKQQNESFKQQNEELQEKFVPLNKKIEELKEEIKISLQKNHELVIKEHENSLIQQNKKIEELKEQNKNLGVGMGIGIVIMIGLLIASLLK